MLQMAKRLSARGTAARAAALALAIALACFTNAALTVPGLAYGQAYAADLAAGGITASGAKDTQLTPQAGVTLNADHVDLYGVEPDVVEKSGPIPPSKLTEFQLEVTGGDNPRYRVTDGRSVDVSSAGLITPRYTTYYWKNGVGTTAKPSDMTGVTVEVSLNTGESTVTVYTNNGTATITVNVIDYGYEFFDAALDAYIAENVTDGMTVREKVDVAARYPASFPYKYNASSAYGMFYNEGGDCWASTDMIVKLCKKMGLDAWGRNANIDSGAGSGHRNAIIDVGDGTYLIAEAGYGIESAPRPYYVKEVTSLWNYTVTSSENKEIELIQYDGKTWPEHFEVPRTVDGYMVTSLGKTSLYRGKFKSVSIPDTVTSIGPFAFSGCSNLESFEIGPQITSVQESAFVQCDNLVLSVASDNPNYSVEGNALYNKDKTVLVSAQNVLSITIPETVTEIGDDAFYCNSRIKEVTIPASVQHIGDYAFVRTGITKYVFQPKAAPTLESYSMASLNKNCEIRIPIHSTGYDVEPWTKATIIKPTMADAVVVLSDLSYAYDGNPKTPQVVSVSIDGEQLEAGVDYTLDGYSDNVNAGMGKVRLIGGGEVMGSKDAEFTILPIDLSLASYEMTDEALVYTGGPIQPAVTNVMLGTTSLMGGSDYKLEYKDNVNAGVAEVSIVGIGNYCGRISSAFSISPAVVALRDGKTVEATSALTYGQKVSEIEVANASFVDAEASGEIAGTFALDEPDAVLDAGQHEVAWTFTPSSANYAPCKGTLVVTVDKAIPTLESEPAIAGIVYHPARTLAAYAIGEGNVSVSGAWSWNTPDVIPAVPGGTFECTFTPDDFANYETLSAVVDLVVSKAIPFTSAEASQITYGQSLADSTLSGKAQYSESDQAIVSGTFSWVDGAVHPSVADGDATPYEVLFTPADTANYEPVKTSVTLPVAKADHPSIWPSDTYNVAYSVAKLSNDIIGLDDWRFDQADIDKTLEPNVEATFMATYVGEDAANYENTTAQVKIVRSTCNHESVKINVVRQPTCAEAGLEERYCTVCDELLDTRVIPKTTDHVWGEWKTVTEATESAEGLKEHTCERCNVVEQQVIPKLEPVPAPGSESSAAPMTTVISGPISPSNPVAAEAVEKQILGLTSDSDPAGSTFSLLQARGVAKSKTAVKVSWKRVAGATGYVVYGNKCGKGNKYVKITTVKGTSFTQKKLKKGTYYKYLVVAVKGNAALAIGKTIHVATKGGKVGNAKSVRTKAKKKVTLKKGKKLKLKAKAVPQSKKLKVKKHRAIAYDTTDPAVATVSSKGEVVAKKPGTCTVYAYAQNGVCKAVKVTVK